MGIGRLSYLLFIDFHVKLSTTISILSAPEYFQSYFHLSFKIHQNKQMGLYIQWKVIISIQ